MTDIKGIIDKFGGQVALAKAIGVAQSNVAYWKKVDRIPAKWMNVILTAAKLRNISLDDPKTESPFVFYTSKSGESETVRLWVQDDSVWATQSGIAQIFDTTKQNISYHLSCIFKDEELEEKSVVKKFLTTASDGKEYEVAYYGLDVILAIGYRVSSAKAITFRRWATQVLKEYLIKGFALNMDRLKQGEKLFGKDYFDELLEKVREIRASERRFYQKVTDIYSQCSIDYDSKSQTTKNFFASVQDKLHFAVHGHTAAELIAIRADANKPNMGLTNWKSKSQISFCDTTVAKNYLTREELTRLNRLVNMFLDYAENIVANHRTMTMSDWVESLDSFIEFNGFLVLKGHGTMSRKQTDEIAKEEFQKFKKITDKTYKSDYDEFLDDVRNKMENGKGINCEESQERKTH